MLIYKVFKRQQNTETIGIEDWMPSGEFRREIKLFSTLEKAQALVKELNPNNDLIHIDEYNMYHDPKDESTGPKFYPTKYLPLYDVESIEID